MEPLQEIILPARYGMKHKLVQDKGDLWHIEFDKNATGMYRCIGFEGEDQMGSMIYTLDPEGGPYLNVGSEIQGYLIKSITNDGIFELIKID